jgi:tight adherence protein C
MPFSPPIVLLPLLWAAAAGLLGWYCARAATHVTYATLADGRRQERRLPLLFRLLLPLAPNVARWARAEVFAREVRQIEGKLVAAGFEGVLGGIEYVSLRILVPLVAGPVLILLSFIVLRVTPGMGFLYDRQLYFYIILMLYLYLFPSLWLRLAFRTRHRSIEKALPFVLDLLTLSVEAGLDFMTAIKRIITTRRIDPLNEELIRVFREVQLGKTRREALRDMARRSMHPDLGGVVHALVQADELGVSIGNILRIQADQVRQRRFQRAEQMAQEAPVKMLFPLVVFIFPTVFLVLLGPVILELLRYGF